MTQPSLPLVATTPGVPVIATTHEAPPATTPSSVEVSGPSPLALLLAGVAIALAAVGFSLTTDNGVRTADVVRFVLLAGWAIGGAAATRETTARRLGFLVLLGTITCAVRGIAAGLVERGDLVSLAEAAEPLAAGAVVALAAHVVVVLPYGRLVTSGERVVVAGIYAAAAAVGVARWAASPAPPIWPLVVLGLVATAISLPLTHRRYVETVGVVRQRLQWLGLAAALVVETTILVLSMRLLLKWPDHAGEVIATSLLLIAFALVAGSSRRLVGTVEHLLQHSVTLAGISALVVATYLVIVVGLGRVPTDDEREILVLSMVAAAVAAVLFIPARQRLNEIANRLVYGDASDPSEALETFGQRLTRALPMDELLLQLVELLKKHMGLARAEVWSGADGHYERVASVPDQGPGMLVLGDKELPVVARSGVAGRAWASVWLPSMLEHRGPGPVRVTPMTSQGDVFGLIFIERSDGQDEFTEDDERVLTELARQVGLALKNTSLDLALQASLEEVKKANVELRESRARVVASGDAERRKIERNLHDGAQQHLVALAVKLRLIERIAANDLAAGLAMLEEARTDVHATVDELRSLAHGIYPPLLMDRGLPEALRAAAARAVLPTTVDADGVDRYEQDAEAAVYFCVLEALQNAGKHAGEGATISVVVEALDDELRFGVTDDGAGFDLDEGHRGHGFVNMADRLGAIGGSVAVWSEPGRGTRITGRIPAAAPRDT